MAKTKKKAKGKAGRPRKVITPNQLAKAEQLAFEGHQNGTIADIMDWEHSFISEREDIRKILTKKRAERKVWLRKKQNSTAGGRSKSAATMQIFLGKNELGQADKVDTKLDAGNAPAVVIIGANSRDGGSAADNND